MNIKDNSALRRYYYNGLTEGVKDELLKINKAKLLSKLVK
jgi:hypothetical protein